MEKPERSVYTPQDFLQWREGGTLELTPKFQRRGVWTAAARSFFMDSLLREMPVPPIYIRLTQSADKKKVIRQIIDGQQRVSCVLDFLDGEFRLSKTISAAWAGKTFDGLTEVERNIILAHSFSAEIFKGITDLEVLDLFARLNTYSVPLNAQELRNGRYFGLFKQSAYALAYEHLEFWRRNSIFGERSIARMLEVELTSELLIAQMDGMQDKKSSIDSFYAKNDDVFPSAKKFVDQFKEVIDTIGETFGEKLKDTEFVRPPLFYTLFCVLLHRRYGLPNINEATPKKALSKDDRVALFEAASRLTEIIQAGRDEEPVPVKYESFVTACLRQTDNIKPREIRFKQLYRSAFSG